MISWHNLAPMTCRRWRHCGGYTKLSYRMLLINSTTGCVRALPLDAQAFRGATRTTGLAVVDMDALREENTCATPDADLTLQNIRSSEYFKDLAIRWGRARRPALRDGSHPELCTRPGSSHHCLLLLRWHQHNVSEAAGSFKSLELMWLEGKPFLCLRQEDIPQMCSCMG